jgi:hypothetical protein
MNNNKILLSELVDSKPIKKDNRKKIIITEHHAKMIIDHYTKILTKINEKSKR